MKSIKPSKIIGAFCMLIAVSFMFITPIFAAEDTSGAPGASGSATDTSNSGASGTSSTSSASSAVGNPCDSTVKAVKEANGCPDVSNNEDKLPKIAVNVINAIIAVTGIVAVIAIVYGGVQYMTSTGNTDKIQKAKHTILYAVIGLIICVLAFAIVNFVIKNILKL